MEVKNTSEEVSGEKTLKKMGTRATHFEMKCTRCDEEESYLSFEPVLRCGRCGGKSELIYVDTNHIVAAEVGPTNRQR